MRRVLASCWFSFIMFLTGPLPDIRPVRRFRGWILRPCFRHCGKRLEICTNANVVYTTNVWIGDDVLLAYGCWVQGVGGVTIEDEVMLGPYTILASSLHTLKDGSYKRGVPRRAPIVLKRGAWTGSHVVINAGRTVGRGSACAAGAVVTKDVPDFVVVGGVPARIIQTTTGENAARELSGSAV